MCNSHYLYERLRQMKARTAIQKWEARHIDRASGGWPLFASTRSALVITAAEASLLWRRQNRRRRQGYGVQ